jgi:hypothetical protein
MEMPRASEASASNHLIHEQKLAAALRDLIRQIDLGDYRDSLDHKLRNNLAYLQAQAVVDRFGLTHELLCETLEDCDLSGDMLDAAQRLFEAREAKPSDTPPEYQTWTSGP